MPFHIFFVTLKEFIKNNQENIFWEMFSFSSTLDILNS